MRFFLSLVILFAIAIGIAVGAHFNHGNVVLFYAPYRVDLSLNLFAVLAVALFALTYFIITTIRDAQKIPQRVSAYRREKREREGNRALRDALKAYFEGRFGHAEKAAMRAEENTDNAGLSALIGARAAHRLGQPERRDVWLAKTKEEQALKTARLMTTIELLNDERSPEGALEAVEELNSSGTRHIHALRMALQANQRAKNWPEVLRLVRLLDKRSALHPALSRKLRELAYADLFGHGHDVESIRRVWNEVPSEDRLQPFVAILAANSFNARGLHDAARNVIEKSLATEWDERLIRAYGASAAAEGSPALLAQIEHCEQWRAKHPADAELELTLGALCLRQKLWGKAQRHLEQALSDAVEAETVRQAHLKLAQLHEALNQDEQAAAHYRQCALATML